MVAWFLTAILTVGLFAYISLTGVSIVSNTQNSAQRSEAVRRLDMVVQGLQSQSAAPLADGVIYAPAGTFRNGLYGLPSALLPVGVTAFGSKFVYCPMGGPIDTANDNVTFNGGSYGVRTAELNDLSYVVTGRAATTAAADQNVIAFVIAQESGEGAMPGCNDVVRNGDAYTAPNGIVRVLRRANVADVDANRSNAGNIWYVTSDGRGSGQSPSTPASFDAAVAAYRTSLGDSFRIVLGPGTYSSQSAILDQSVTSMAAKKDGSALILSATSAATIRIAGSVNVPSSLEVRNVDLTGTPAYAESGRYLQITNSSMGPVIAKTRSKVMFTGSNVVRGMGGIAGLTGALLQQAGSTVVAKGTLTIQYVNGQKAWKLEPGSSGTMTEGSAVNLNPADSSASGNVQYSLIDGDAGSQMVMKSGTVNSNGPASYPVITAGRLTAYTTKIYTNAYALVGVQGTSGARIDLPNVEIRGSSPPNYAVSATGTGSFTGYGNLYSTNRCWYRNEGSLFRLSPVGVQGATSAVTPSETPPGMDLQPSATQVRRYQIAVSRNLERPTLKSNLESNTVGFSCQQAAAPVWTNPACAGEGGYCNVPNYTIVRYGANTSYYNRYSGDEGIPCDNATFGDPLVGTVKSCQYLQ